MRTQVRDTTDFPYIAAPGGNVRPFSTWPRAVFFSAFVGAREWSKRSFFRFCGLALMLLIGVGGLAAQSGYAGMSNVRLLLDEEELLVMEGGMSIDADGAPHAYSPIPEQGLDALEHAGSPGNWAGIATREGEPIVQGPDEPAPGYYVSTTALQDFSYPFYRQERYVDASRVPYLALPATANGPQLGDLALVVNIRTHKASPAIFADISSVPGEGSIELARRLGIHADARRGGADGGILYFVFSHSGNRTLPDSEEMSARVQELWSSSAVQDVWRALCLQHSDWSCSDVALNGANNEGRIQEVP